MKKTSILILVVTICTSVFSKGGIVFYEGSLSDAVVKAQQEDKMIFIDCYTTWCSPCKRLAKDIFPLPEVGEFFNKNFVAFKIDMEKKDGSEIFEKFKVNRFPTMLFLDKNGKEQYRTTSYQLAPALIEAGKTALDYNRSLESFHEQYKEGDRNAPFIIKYMEKLKEADERILANDVMDEFAEGIPEQLLLKNDNVNLIANYVTNPNSKVAQYLIANKGKFGAVQGSEVVDKIIASINSKDHSNWSTSHMALINEEQSYGGSGSNANFDLFKYNERFPDYLNDTRMMQDITNKSTVLFNEGKCKGGYDLRNQLKNGSDETVVYNEFKLGKKDLFNFKSQKEGVLIIVKLYLCGGCPNNHVITASGFVINSNGVCATNHHVFNKIPEDTHSYLSYFAVDHQGNTYPIERIINGDERTDLALFKINAKLKPLRLGEDSQIGDDIHIISHPDDNFYSYSTGKVTRQYMSMRNNTPLQSISADFSKGSSGAPIFDDKGQVIGVVTSTKSIYYSQNENLQMVIKEIIPVSLLKELCQTL